MCVMVQLLMLRCVSPCGLSHHLGEFEASVLFVMLKCGNIEPRDSSKVSTVLKPLPAHVVHAPLVSYKRLFSRGGSGIILSAEE